MTWCITLHTTSSFVSWWQEGSCQDVVVWLFSLPFLPAHRLIIQVITLLSHHRGFSSVLQQHNTESQWLWGPCSVYSLSTCLSSRLPQVVTRSLESIPPACLPAFRIRTSALSFWVPCFLLPDLSKPLEAVSRAFPLTYQLLSQQIKDRTLQCGSQERPRFDSWSRGLSLRPASSHL